MPHKPKAVFDTNIYISAIIFGGPPQICFEAARNGEVTLFTSKAILLELANKLRFKFGWSEEDIQEVLVGILKFARLATPKTKLNIVKNDLSDNKILEVSLEVKADFLVSGDKKHLLSLRSFRKIKIVTATEFLNII